MKRIAIALLILISAQLFAQTTRSYPAPKAVDYLGARRLSLSDFGLKGKVKTYKGVEWDTRGYSPYNFTWRFNESGQLMTQYLSYVRESETGFKYDAEGRLIECFENIDGNYRQMFSYDKAGYLSLITDANDGINVNGRIEFSYQDTTYTVTKTGGSGWEVIVFNSQGKPVNTKTYTGNGFNTRTIDYQYIPTEGYTIIIEGRATSEESNKKVEKRNAEGQLTEFTHFNNAGEIVETHQYTYDSEGRCIVDKGKQSLKDPIITTTYEYTTDEMGNVTKVIISGDSEPYEFTWEIEYY